jgi:hypothetical protein
MEWGRPEWLTRVVIVPEVFRFACRGEINLNWLDRWDVFCKCGSPDDRTLDDGVWLMERSGKRRRI